MTASKKKTVWTRRGVEPAGRPARRETERGRRARTNSSRTFAQRAGLDAPDVDAATVLAVLLLDVMVQVRAVEERRRNDRPTGLEHGRRRVHWQRLAPRDDVVGRGGLRGNEVRPWTVERSTRRVALLAATRRSRSFCATCQGPRTRSSDRSALCDFFDSQRAFAPPGRVRAPLAAREGSGALGEEILRNY